MGGATLLDPEMDRKKNSSIFSDGKTIPDVFSDDCATSESLCYTHGRIPYQFGGRGKQISDFRDFRSTPVPGVRQGRPEHRQRMGEGVRSREKPAKRFS